MAAANRQLEPSLSRDAMVDTLRPKFLAALRKRQLELLKIRDRLAASGEMNDEGFVALRDIAHRIHGSAATFGFEKISEAAAVLERAAESKPAERDEKTILASLDALLKRCRAAQRSEPEAAAAASTEQAAAPAPPESSPPAPNAETHILLVEDDPTMHLLVRELLADEGVVHCAESAADAKRLIKDMSPDLILADNNLATDVTGLDLVESLKADPKYADLPVIMLTSSDNPDDIMRALVAGAVDYISKPIKPGPFVEKISEFLRARHTLVLIADDDAPVREILARKFQAVGIRTIEAVTGEEAFALAQKHKPRLVLLDRMMPGYDGVTVLQKMRNDPALRDIPIVFLTARRHEEDILEGLKLGAADYIVKPFNADIVVTRCMRLLKNQQAAEQ